MSVIPPKSSDFLAGSSLGFVKPMPSRAQESPVLQGDSAEFEVDVRACGHESAMDLWRRLQPEQTDSGGTAEACAGLMLGHFRIEEQIGRGGMGAVFRAVDTRLDREVALKVLAGTQAADRGSVDRFLNEARSAARLDHGNVARVFYVGEDRGLHFIAFEFIHGANVRQLIDASGAVAPAEAVNYGLQIANALRHIAAAGVVHRDIKPSNIIITPAGRAKLVDLGLARKIDPDASKDLTVDGTTLGTFDYISPEQAKDPRRVDIRSDIYSLGCTLYHMLTGEPPYPRGTMLQKLLDHQHKDVPEAASRNPNVPPELSAVIRKMMASDPADRYDSADELISDLSLLAHAYGLRPTVPESLVWSVPTQPSGWALLRRYRAWVVTAAALVVGVLLVDFIQSRALREESIAATSAAPSMVEDLPPQRQAEVERPGSSDPEGPSRPETRPSLNASRGGLEVDTNGAPSLPEDSTSLVVSDGNSVQSSGIMTNQRYGPAAGIFNSPFVPMPLVQPFSLEDGSKSEQGGVTEPPETEPPAETDLVPDVVEVPVSRAEYTVRVDDNETREFATLEAACNAAPDGSAIELNFDGPSAEMQRPLSISGKRLRLRPGPGRRPIVRFARPDDWTSAEIVRMISVNRGSLEVYQVGFEIIVDPEFFTENWVLLALAEAEEVILQGVSVTVRNSENRRPAAVVELAERSSRFEDRMPDADRPPVRFEAEDCFFRGQADLFLCENVDPARIRLANVAVGLDGSMLQLRGMDSIDVLSDMNNEHRVELDLRHVTALITRELLNFDIEPGRSVPRVSVSANNCVLVTDSGPLVRMSGEIDAFDARELLEWSGDHSFLQSPDPVWLIEGLIDEWAYDLVFWNELWRQGRLERADGISLLNFDWSTAFDQISRDELSLTVSEEGNNPAREGASDGSDAGIQWDALRLPAFVNAPEF